MKKQIYCYLMVLIACFSVMISPLFCGSAFATEPVFPVVQKHTKPVQNKDISSDGKQSTLPDGEKNISTASPVVKPLAPMAEKHIFSPEPDGINDTDMIKNQDIKGNKGNGAQQSIDLLMQKVQREMELTGIIITPSSKKAMILYKGKGSKKQVAELYDAGASIDEYLLKEVFPNYVVIAQNNLEIKLGLFKERNNRPESPKEEVNQNNSNKADNRQGAPLNQGMLNPESPPDIIDAAQDGISTTSMPRPIPKAMQDANAQANPFEKVQDGNNLDVANPFARALQGAPSGISGETTSFKNNTDSNSAMGGDNPFLQAIQRARERQRSQQ